MNSNYEKSLNSILKSFSKKYFHFLTHCTKALLLSGSSRCLKRVPFRKGLAQELLCFGEKLLREVAAHAFAIKKQ